MGQRDDEASARRTEGGSAVDELPLTGEPLPLELVNTTYIRGGVRGSLVDVLKEPADLDRWIHLHLSCFGDVLGPTLSAAGPADSAHLGRFLHVRFALRELATARTSGKPPALADTQAVNAAARLSPHWQELAPGPAFILVTSRPEPDPLLAALGEIAVSGVRLLAGAEGELLRACPAPGCVLYFVKRHARRAWCTPGCGNRVRVARHSRRTRL